jgi:hypothetical protein
MKIQIILSDAKIRITKMIEEHCWDVIKDLLNDIGDCSEQKNVQSIKDIEMTLEMIKKVQNFKDKVSSEINNKNTLCEILELCQNDIITENEDDIISSFFGYEIKIEK